MQCLSADLVCCCIHFIRRAVVHYHTQSPSPTTIAHSSIHSPTASIHPHSTSSIIAIIPYHPRQSAILYFHSRPSISYILQHLTTTMDGSQMEDASSCLDLVRDSHPRLYAGVWFDPLTRLHSSLTILYILGLRLCYNGIVATLSFCWVLASLAFYLLQVWIIDCTGSMGS